MKLIASVGNWRKTFEGTLPDQETIDIWEFVENTLIYEPPVVSTVVQAKNDAVAAKEAAQDILDQVEAGVVPDDVVSRTKLSPAVRTELDGYITQAEADARVTAVGNATYATRAPSPEVFDAPANGTDDDSAAFQAMLADSSVTIANLRSVTPIGGSSPFYSLAETVDVSARKSLKGEGWRSRIKVPADGGNFAGDIMFRLNTNSSHGWVQSFPGLPATCVENLMVQADAAAAAGHNLTAFEFGGSHKFSEIYLFGIDVAIKQISQYSDQVSIERVTSWNKPETSNYLVSLVGGGDADRINQLHCSQAPERTTRAKSLYMKFKNGATVDNLINGDVLIEDSRGIRLSSLHMETGQTTLLNSSVELSNCLYFMRATAGLKVVPVVISQASGTTSMRGMSNHLHDIGFVYMTGLPGGYPTDGTANFSITGNGATNRSQVLIRNLYRWVGSSTNYSQDVCYTGVTAGDAVFDAYSHIASVSSEYENGEWNIRGGMSAIPNSAGIDPSSANDSWRAWAGSSGTYYYKVVALHDSKRMVGRVGTSEKSYTVTAGGNSPLIILDGAWRRKAMFRIYRGTSSGSYDKYVDVPLLSGARIPDGGLDVAGFPWISRTAGAVDSVNTDVDAGILLTPGETGAASDAYGHATVYARNTAVMPTAGSWRRGDEVRLVAPRADGANVLLGWLRLTDCTSASPAHVLGTDWSPIYQAPSVDATYAANRGKTFQRPAETVLSVFKSGHGWTTTGTWGASNLSDTGGSWADTCISGTTGGAGAGAVFENLGLLTPFDPAGKTLTLSIKIDDPTKLSGMIVYLSSDSSIATNNTNYDVFNGDASGNPFPAGEFFDLQIPLVNGTVVGTGQGTAVKTMRIRFADRNTGAITVKLGGVSRSATQAKFPNGVVSFAFDDAADDAWLLARPKMSEYRYRGTIYPTIAALGTAGSMTLAQLKSLAAIGWEIGSHNSADTITRLDTLTAAQREAEHQTVKRFLVANGFKSDALAYPGGLWDSATLDSSRRYFSSGRTTRAGLQVLPPTDPMRLYTYLLGPGLTLASAKAKVDQAYSSGTLATFTVHDLSSSGGSFTWTVSDFNDLVDYIATKGMPVLPIGEVLAAFTGG